MSDVWLLLFLLIYAGGCIVWLWWGSILYRKAEEAVNSHKQWLFAALAVAVIVALFAAQRRPGFSGFSEAERRGLLEEWRGEESQELTQLRADWIAKRGHLPPNDEDPEMAAAILGATVRAADRVRERYHLDGADLRQLRAEAAAKGW